MITLLTGLPGAGKTTILARFIERYPGNFYSILSKEIRDEHNNRVGFKATTSDGYSGVFAHKTLIDSEYQIGDYHINLEAIDQLFTNRIKEKIENAPQLLIIDEIGRMQMLSKNFIKTIDRLFKSEITVLATIRHGDDWAEKYKTDSKARVFEVTEQNREEILKKLLDREQGLFS